MGSTKQPQQVVYMWVCMYKEVMNLRGSGVAWEELETGESGMEVM